MSTFRVEYQKLKRQSATLSGNGQKLKGMGNRVVSVKSNLMHMGNYDDVICTIGNIYSQVQRQAGCMGNMGNTLQEIAAVYQNTEQGITGAAWANGDLKAPKENEMEEGGISAGRAAAEMMAEAAVNVGLGILAVTGAVLLGASASAVLVDAAVIGALWAVAGITCFLTGRFNGEEKGLAEFILDSLLDMGEKFMNPGRVFCKWAAAAF